MTGPMNGHPGPHKIGTMPVPEIGAHFPTPTGDAVVVGYVLRLMGRAKDRSATCLKCLEIGEFCVGLIAWNASGYVGFRREGKGWALASQPIAPVPQDGAA